MAIRLDLKPNRKLLDPKFESYRLSLDPLPVLKQNLQEGVQNIHLGDDRFSYLEICLSGLLNHLCQDPYTPECVFYVNETNHICWICLSQDGRLTERRVVWQIPIDSSDPSANATINFAALEWAVVGNGGRIIYILNTPSRSQGEPWQLLFTYFVDNCSSFSRLLTSTYTSFPNRHQIDCIFVHVSKPQDVQGNCKLPETTVHFILVLEWFTFSETVGNESNMWNLKRSRRLVGSSVPQYITIEPGGSALCLITEKEFSFIYDSRKQEEERVIEEQKVKVFPPLYTYIQSMEDITVIFRLPDNICKNDIRVVLEPSILEVQVKEKTVLEGPLCHKINTDGSTWIIEEKKLEITLNKSESGLVWAELVKGNDRGEEVMDPSLVAEMHNRLACLMNEAEAHADGKPPYNAQQLEECDVANEFLMFVRFDGDTHRPTHHINLGGHQWLFNTTSTAEALPVICLRYDVDGLIWQPKNISSEGEDEQFKMEHIATYPALGYVVASKQDRKFVIGSPNFNFAVVCDNVRHVYIYRQPESLNTALELRNRKTGQEVSRIAKLYVINLENCQEILGLQASKNCIFVLSKKALYAIKISDS